MSKHSESGPASDIWREINKIWDELRSVTIRKSPSIRFKKTAQGTTIEAISKQVNTPSTPGTVKAYNFVAYFDDYITATEIGGDLQMIAKPFLMRRTPFHGITITKEDEQGRAYLEAYNYLSGIRRIVTINPGSPNQIVETQIAIPRRLSGDIIFASTSENGTGVTGVDLIDLSSDQRWARER